MTKKQQKIMIIGIITILLILMLVGVIALTRGSGSKDNSTSEIQERRSNMLSLARDYAAQGEYESALDMINSLLIDNPGDEEARKLFNEIIAMKQASENSDQSELQVLKDQNDQLANSLTRLNTNLNRGNSGRKRSPSEKGSSAERRSGKESRHKETNRRTSSIRQTVAEKQKIR